MILPEFESVGSFTPEEFLQFVREREAQGDVHHYELLHGRIVMSPPAGWPHGSVGAKFLWLLQTHVAKSSLGRVFDASQGFTLPSRDIVEPDVAFVGNERWKAMPEPEEGKFLEVVPDLLVETLSKGNASRDRGEKRGIYEKNGVREYWMIDPRAQRVTLLVLEGAAYREAAVGEIDGAVASHILPGFAIDLPALFS